MRVNLQLLMFLLLVSIGAVQCNSDDVTEVGNRNDILGSLSLYSDNYDISIKNEDVKGEFVLETKKAFDKDVVINLSVATKGVSLPIEKIHLPAGDLVVKGDVLFSKDVFNDVEGNYIEVKLVAESKDVVMSSTTVVYDVRRYIYGAPEMTIDVDTANVEVFYEDVPVTITVRSDNPLTEDAIFELSADGGNEGVDFNFPNKKITIKKGERSGSVVLTLLKSSFVDGNTDKETGKPGDKAMDIGVKMKTTASVNIAKSTTIINALGGFFTKTYCLPYMVSIASHYMRTFTIAGYTLDPPHLVNEKHYYEDLRNSLENPIGRIEVPTGVSPLSFVTESKPGYGEANFVAVAWIDWNQDGDFKDDGEFVANIPYQAKEEKNGAVYSTDVKTPLFVKPGMSTVMRIGVISAKSDLMTESGGCGGSSQGDVVDVRIYIVKGEDPVAYTANLTNETIAVNGSDVVKTIVATLPNEAEDDVEINVLVSGGDKSHYTLSSDVIIIKKGTKNGNVTIKLKKEFYQIALQNEDFKIELKPKNPYRYTAGSGTKATLHVTGVGTKPTASINVTTTDITVLEGQDKTVDVKLKLSEPDKDKDVNVSLTVGPEFTDMAILSPKSVTISKGSVEAVATITFKSNYFPFKGDIKEIPLTISSTNVLIDPNKERVVFKVQGSVVKPPLVNLNIGSPYIADVTKADYVVDMPLWTKSAITQDVQVEVSFVGENADKAYFDGGVHSKIITLKPNGSSNTTEYFKFYVKQSAFVIDKKGQTVTMHIRSYGKSNIDLGGGVNSKDIIWSVVRRQPGTYCPIVGSGDADLYITNIKVGGKNISGSYTDAYNDMSSEVFDMKGKFEMEITVHKNASVPNGKYELAVFIDRDNDYVMNDYWGEFMQLQKENGSGSADSRTEITMDKSDKTFVYKGQYDLDRLTSRVRIALTRGNKNGIGTNPTTGCMVGDTFEGTVVDVSWRKN